MDQRDNRRQIKTQCTDTDKEMCVWSTAEFKQASLVLWQPLGIFFFPFLSTLQSGTNYHNLSGEQERVLTNVKDGGVKCIVLRRRRQVRERGGNRGIDSSQSYPYCLWAHVGWTCWTPTERPADKDRQREREREYEDILAIGSTHNKKETGRQGQSRFTPSLSLLVCLRC